MTSTTQTNIVTPPVQRTTLARSLRKLFGRLSQPASTAPKRTNHSLNHIPPHIRMDIALDDIERARLLQGGLR